LTAVSLDIGDQHHHQANLLIGSLRAINQIVESLIPFFHYLIS